MNLVMYSGGQDASNHKLHEAVSQISDRRNKSRIFTYVPFTSEGSKAFFARAVRRYKRYGFRKFECLPADQAFTRAQIKQCLRSDVIYLSGGNTFYFLHHLRRSGLLKELKAFAEKGGVLAGLSAGAILMTKNIHLAGYPGFDRDDNDVGIKNFNSLNLVDFEFFPHHSRSARLKKALESYSRKTPRIIYGVEDGGGIAIQKGNRTFFGNVYLYYQGKQIKIQSNL